MLRSRWRRIRAILEQSAGLRARTVPSGGPPSPAYVLLHVGKTGGTYVQFVLSCLGVSTDAVICTTHDISLSAALTRWPERQIVFGIRSPEQIFISGFYSRQRQGLPRYNSPWSPAEQVAFSRFTTPNQLAEALGSDCTSTRRAAESAMTDIAHVNRGLRAYLDSATFVRAHAARIGFILRQDHLDDDLRQWLDGFVPAVRIPDADVFQRHSSPPGLDVHLTDDARSKVARWYEMDFAIYEACLDIAAALRRGR